MEKEIGGFYCGLNLNPLKDNIHQGEKMMMIERERERETKGGGGSGEGEVDMNVCKKGSN